MSEPPDVTSNSAPPKEPRLGRQQCIELAVRVDAFLTNFKTLQSFAGYADDNGCTWSTESRRSGGPIPSLGCNWQRDSTMSHTKSKLSTGWKLALVALWPTAMLLTGCQVEMAGQTLPSPWYLTDDIQYYAQVPSSSWLAKRPPKKSKPRRSRARPKTLLETNPFLPIHSTQKPGQPGRAFRCAAF